MRRHAFDVGSAAERIKRDFAGARSELARHEGVPEFVHDHAAEDDREQRQAEEHAGRALIGSVTKLIGYPDRGQGQRWVHPNIDSGELSQGDAAEHVSLSWSADVR